MLLRTLRPDKLMLLDGLCETIENVNVGQHHDTDAFSTPMTAFVVRGGTKVVADMVMLEGAFVVEK